MLFRMFEQNTKFRICFHPSYDDPPNFLYESIDIVRTISTIYCFTKLCFVTGVFRIFVREFMRTQEKLSYKYLYLLKLSNKHTQTKTLFSRPKSSCCSVLFWYDTLTYQFFVNQTPVKESFLIQNGWCFGLIEL